MLSQIWPDKPDGTNRYLNYYVYDALNRATRVCDDAAASQTACKTAATPLLDVAYDELSRLVQRTVPDYNTGSSVIGTCTPNGFG